MHLKDHAPIHRLAKGEVIQCSTPGCTRKVLWSTTLGICKPCYVKRRRVNGKDNYTEENRIRAWTRQGIPWTNTTVRMYDQATTCSLCDKPFKNARDKHLDHDHQTREPRGVLCVACNIDLSRFCDSPRVLEKAAAYLRQTRPWRL